MGADEIIVCKYFVFYSVYCILFVAYLCVKKPQTFSASYQT